ncbi:hypothetical protein BDV29DRAFT_178684 [Aspergillus leporis]|uniref:Uncharacterized protein n=1 Tax=Aspergillus leporis TaxID=41062 RepID=A0A5N5WTE7_9EURO|nr:hypothetical protein BDV29DRAFT_178684 [Aspergillus leporis]
MHSDIGIKILNLMAMLLAVLGFGCSCSSYSNVIHPSAPLHTRFREMTLSQG